MKIDNIVNERKRLEYIVDHCKFETAQQVCELFEAYTHLIWKYKQVGRIYDFYYDGMMIHREGGNDLIGVDKVVQDTLACLAAFPDMEFKFYGIHGTGNPEDGFRFGQAVHFAGTFLGVSKYGRGTGAAFEPHECVDLCECLVKKVDGRWRVVEEWGNRSTLAFDRVLKQAKSFLDPQQLADFQGKVSYEETYYEICQDTYKEICKEKNSENKIRKENMCEEKASEEKICQEIAKDTDCGATTAENRKESI